MIRHLKYAPFGWRKGLSRERPERPESAEMLRTCTIRLGSSTFSCKVPPHQPCRRKYASPYGPLDFPNLESWIEPVEGEREQYPGSYVIEGLIGRRTAFYAPWFRGPRVDLKAWWGVMRHRHINPAVNLFNPVAFEQVITDYLNESYGHGIAPSCEADEYLSCYTGPHDWRARAIGDVEGASFTVNTRNIATPAQEYTVFPVTPHHFMRVRLTTLREAPLDEMDLSYFEHYKRAVIESLHVSLSPAMRELRDRGIAEAGGRGLTTSFAPFAWPVGGQAAIDRFVAEHYPPGDENGEDGTTESVPERDITPEQRHLANPTD